MSILSRLRGIRHARMLLCSLIAVALWLFLWHASPREALIVTYKVTLVLLAAVAAYWIDRWLFPYARPEGYLCEEWRDRIGSGDWPDGVDDFPVVTESKTLFMVASLRRILLMGMAMLAVGLGL